MPLKEGPSDAATPLPEGGGAQESTGESFEVDLATGSGSYRVPFVFPPGPHHVKPELSLGYGTGYGNGLVGLGWTLSLSAITRSRTDGQPAFDDARDVFTYAGQRLVPVGGGRFRQEVEKDFHRVARSGDGWEVRRPDGTRLLFGTAAAGRLELAVAGPDRTYQWLLESVEDASGNRLEYEYLQDGGHARLAGIAYGPYRVRLDYDLRPDPITSHRFGVERVLRHRLRELRLVLVPEAVARPVKAYRLGYEQAPHSLASRLTSVTLVGFDPAAPPPGEDALPPLTFTYANVEPARASLRPITTAGSALPPPVATPGLALVDVEGTGLPGFLHLSPSGGYYWPNLGDLEVGGARSLRHFPTALADSPDRVRVASLSGHGLLDLVVMAGRAGGYYALQPGGEWEPFRPFKRAPAVPTVDTRTKLVDLNFDGQADLLYADQRALYAVVNRGGGDFDDPRVTPRIRDRAAFPDVDLGDPHVHFADMNGDGTAAIVEVRDRAVLYWPNLGYGRFGHAVRMDAPPALPRPYDPARVFFVDVDGDGLADIVYVDQNRVWCWFNRSGLGFAPPVVIERTPSVGGRTVALVDLLGQGRQGLLWSGSDLASRSSHFFLDFTGPLKANLLTGIRTPNGLETTIRYGTSVTEAARDRGTPDAAYLPFPVQVVRRVEAIDPHSGASMASEFAYHRGFYDRREKRFLGFGRVERRDVGGADAPDRITVTHFHTSPPDAATREAVRRHFVLSRLPFRTEVFGGDDPDVPFWVQHIDGEAVQVDVGTEGTPIYFSARRDLRRRTTDRGARTLERDVHYEHDAFGNVTLERETQRFVDGGGVPREITKTIETRYVGDGPEYLVGLQAEAIERDGDGVLLAATRTYYDGDPFVGLPLGQATRGVLARREALAFTDALVTDLYGVAPPDLATLGYVHRNDPKLGPGWWATETSQQADARGNPMERRDPLGAAVLAQFDAHGIYPVRIENALGQVLTSEYDYRHGQLVRQVDRDGGVTEWHFDLHGRLVAQARPQDADARPSVLFERAPFENPPRVTVRARILAGADEFEVQHHFFDGRGERLQSRLEVGGGEVAVSQSAVAYARGQPTIQQGRYFSASAAFSTADAPVDVVRTRTRRDALDRPVEFVDAGGVLQRRRYEAGAIHHVDAHDADPASPFFNTPRSEFFDAAARLISVIERPAGAEWCTQYERNAAGQLLGAIDHLGSRIFAQRYDFMGRLVALDHREAGIFRYVLDASGHRVEERRGAARVFREFDALGRIRVLRLGAPDAVPVERYTYDAGPGDRLVGRLARVDGDFGSVEYSYTRCGHLKAKTRVFPDRPGESFSIRYTYDLQSRPRSVTYPDGEVVDIGYDAGGRPRNISGVLSTAEYDATGYVTRLQFTNGVETRYQYDAVPGRVRETRTGLPAGDTYQHFQYTFDAVGNPTRIDDVATVAGHVRDARIYSYDALYRLVSAAGRDANGPYNHVYGYDNRGNLLTRPDVPGAPGLTYTDARVTGSTTGEAFAYDDRGNLTAEGGWTHAYDPFGRLVTSTDEMGREVTTLYDHTGARVRTLVRAAGNVTRAWFCDDLFTIEENGTTESSIFFNRHLIAVQRSTGQGHVVHPDPLGNPTCYSSLADGSFSGQTVFYPYGGVALEMAFGAASRQRYGGHDRVPGTALLHFGLRTYSPRLGRFLQPDPHIVHRPDGAIELPRGLHAYGYVLGNPASLIDPFGANWFTDAVDWVGDRIADAGRAIAGAVETVAGAIVDGVLAVAGFIGAAAEAIWDGIKAVAGFVWEAVKWAAGVVWEGIKFLGQALAFIGTWALTIADFLITWLNPLNWIAIGLDQIDHPVADVFSFIIKFARSPITTLVGVGIGLVGLATGDVENVAFKNGLIVFEWDPSSSGFSGTTLGGTVHLWSGSANDDAFEHETYHSYQYAGWGDSFIPTYAAFGGWGLLSSAMAGNPQWTCFGGVSNGYSYGQPLEMGGEIVDPSANCA